MSETIKKWREGQRCSRCQSYIPYQKDVAYVCIDLNHKWSRIDEFIVCQDCAKELIFILRRGEDRNKKGESVSFDASRIIY